MPRKIKQPDPAEQHNASILADIEERKEKKFQRANVPVDLGLNLQPRKPATSAAEVLRDAWDKRNFGNPQATYTRKIYGPDPLLISCPGLKDMIEKAGGLEAFAETAAELVVLKQERAFDDPMLRLGIHQAIKEFGVHNVAEAVRSRFLSIPVREVEIENDSDIDDVFGKPLDEAVARYGSPGMAPKFLSERCIAAFGMRGYRPVIDEHGNVVKVGTLIMGEIPQAKADARKAKILADSRQAVTEQEENYLDSQARFLHEAGRLGRDMQALTSRDSVSGAKGEAWNSEAGKHGRVNMEDDRPVGLRIEREGEAAG